MSSLTQDKKILIKPPKEAFPKCPACLSTAVKELIEDVYCADCGWDSVEAHGRALADARIRVTPPIKMIKNPKATNPNDLGPELLEDVVNG